MLSDDNENLFGVIERSKCSLLLSLLASLDARAIKLVDESRQVALGAVVESVNDQLLEVFVGCVFGFVSTIEQQGDGVNYVEHLGQIVLFVGLRGVFYKSFDISPGLVIQVFGSSQRKRPMNDI